jgi:hypothetical protein
MSETDAAPAADPPDPQDWDGKAIVALMSLPHGRRLVERFLDHCQLNARLYHFDADGLGMAWRDGLADAGRFWEALLLHHCPDLYLRMVKERRARIDRAREQVARKEDRRDPATAAPLTVTGIEELADEQRLTAEAEELRARAAARKRSDKHSPKATNSPKD